MTIMTSYRIRLLLTALAFLLPAVAGATQFSFPEAHCSIAIPDGWTRESDAEKANPIILLAASGSGKTKVVMLVARKLPGVVSIRDSSTRKDLEREARQHGTILSAGLTKLAGMDAYRITAREKIGGTSVEVVTTANGYLYLIRANTKSGDAGKDAEITKIIASFMLMGAPDSSLDAGSLAAAPSTIEGDRVVFDTAQCSVILPGAGWVRVADEKNPKGLLAVIRTDRSRIIMLTTPPFPMSANIRSRVVVDSITASMRRVGTFGPGHFVKLGGIEAYAMTGMAKNSQDQHIYSIQTLANNRLYIITMIGIGADPSKDTDVQIFLDNFAFIGTPRVAPE